MTEMAMPVTTHAILVDVSDTYFFSARGGGRGSPRRQEVGGSIFIENPRRGGGVLQEGEGPRGQEGVCGKLRNWGGGGPGCLIFFFFRGRNVHQVTQKSEKLKGATGMCATGLRGSERFWGL